ncbi:Lrp/AsnC family transcriptional regulator [Rhodobacteraceae bacterium KMS-5]|uniref:Lrp/AsnC family transcriptional regulator n=1 Tax=Tabrizicola oligotrophica TaxID=2710650 RepID=A0A6M0QXB4_9RHOB|nr:Lrp/AsnC family transcriptional regulator [Tabrizicola oligotrophica]
MELAEADRRLLRLVQADARASTQDLAEAAGLTSSPAWRRLKRLEDLGVIRAQVALLDAAKLGLDAQAYVQVSLTDHTEPTVAQFDALVRAAPQILECARVTGGFDYILRVVTRDAEDLERFLMRRLLASGIVRNAMTSFVLRQTKSTTELPLD